MSAPRRPAPSRYTGFVWLYYPGSCVRARESRSVRARHGWEARTRRRGSHAEAAEEAEASGDDDGERHGNLTRRTRRKRRKSGERRRRTTTAISRGGRRGRRGRQLSLALQRQLGSLASLFLWITTQRSGPFRMLAATVHHSELSSLRSLR